MYFRVSDPYFLNEMIHVVTYRTVGKYEEDDKNDNKTREKLNAYLQTDEEKGFDNDLTVEKVKTLTRKENGDTKRKWRV
jgi:TPP-dependent pyruvate/acetoin dehydrogenase alpha subunit